MSDLVTDVNDNDQPDPGEDADVPADGQEPLVLDPPEPDEEIKNDKIEDDDGGA